MVWRRTRPTLRATGRSSLPLLSLNTDDASNHTLLAFDRYPFRVLPTQGSLKGPNQSPLRPPQPFSMSCLRSPLARFSSSILLLFLLAFVLVLSREALLSAPVDETNVAPTLPPPVGDDGEPGRDPPGGDSVGAALDSSLLWAEQASSKYVAFRPSSLTPRSLRSTFRVCIGPRPRTPGRSTTSGHSKRCTLASALTSPARASSLPPNFLPVNTRPLLDA